MACHWHICLVWFRIIHSGNASPFKKTYATSVFAHTSQKSTNLSKTRRSLSLRQKIASRKISVQLKLSSNTISNNETIRTGFLSISILLMRRVLDRQELPKRTVSVSSLSRAFLSIWLQRLLEWTLLKSTLSWRLQLRKESTMNKRSDIY